MYIRPPMPCGTRRPRALLLGLSGMLLLSACRLPAGSAPPPARDAHRLPIHRVAGPAGRVDSGFSSTLRAADPARRFTAIVDLTEQLDLRELVGGRRGAALSKAARRAAVISGLEQVADRQQQRLRPLTDRLLAEGSLSYVRPVAIVNRLIVEGTASGLLALAADREVAAVLPDWTSEPGTSRGEAVGSGEPAPLGDTFRSWAIDAMRADRLWARGLDGKGVVVAAIDTGAFESHEQLRGRRLPESRGWFDPVEGSSEGADGHGHGTSVLSQAVGGNPGGRLVGIAPGARWAAALGNWKNYYSRSRMTLAADWVLRVAWPDVVVNAWSHDEGECSEFDRAFIDAWKAAGIFVVYPAGNAGPNPSTGESPAQLAGIFPDGGPVFSVAALAPSGVVHALSSRGPSRCGSSGFPTLAAPGADLPYAATAGPRAYLRGQGTSLSAGLVGGAAALLLQADPELPPEALERILVRSARDVPPAGRDDAAGAGSLDLEAALALVLAEAGP